MAETTTVATASYDVTTCPEIDYRPKVIEHGSFRYNQLFQVTGGQNQTLNRTAITTSVFEIPPGVLNFSKSILRFRMDTTLSPAGGDAFMQNFIAAGLPMIDRIALFTRGGVYICDITFANFFTNLVAPAITSREKLVSTPMALPEMYATTANNAADINLTASSYNGSSLPVSALLTPHNLYANGGGVAAVGSNPLPDGNDVLNNVITNIGCFNARLRPAEGGTSNERFRYRYTGNTTAVANNSAGMTSLQYNIPLGEIPHSIFSLNRDMLFGEVLLLQIYWAPTQQYNYATALADDTFNANFKTVSMNNLVLQLAREVNPTIVKSLSSLVLGQGIRYTVPYVYTNRYASPSGANISVQVRLNRGHGKSLLVAYNGVYNPNANNHTNMAYVHRSNMVQVLERDGGAGAGHSGSTMIRNGNNEIVEYCYSMLDNERLQEINMTTKDSWDFVTQVGLGNIEDSCIDDLDSYRENWVWIDNWTGLPTCKQSIFNAADCGLDLTQERLYTFFVKIGDAAANNQAPFTAPGAGDSTQGYGNPTIFQFFVTQKTLTVTATQISIV